MCGIAGGVSFDLARPFVAERVQAMVGTLRHRGPDDMGVARPGAAGLGAARLSIIDVAAGHQPISTEDGQVTVAQNGEIYNYVELRQGLLQRGHRFATACDTEVIAHLYEEQGLDCFQQLRGMFAVAIWDQARQRLVLARDRVGKKPLYVYQTNGELLFGSETKAILAALEQVPEVDESALLSYLTFGYVAGEQAIFRGMQRLPPGCVLVADAASGQVRVQPYWQWPRPEQRGANQDEVVEQLRAELDEAVRIRLRSDVPLGAFLSGGVDSATTVALMARHLAQPVKTFSIGFGDPEYDELDDARATARAFGTDHHEWTLQPNSVEVAERLARHFDEPFADESAIPTYYVAELARKHVTVCLTGDGGDELFAGYTPYSDALARQAGWPVALGRAALGTAASRLHPAARGKGRLSTMALGPEAWFVWRRTVFHSYLLPGVLGPRLREARLPLPEQAWLRGVQADRGDLLARLQWWDQHHYLPDDILVKVDRATMAHSLEGRCPLLDQHVVELAARQPSGWHLRGQERKLLFRRAVAPWLPAEVLQRPKRGFGVPLRRWLKEGLIDWAGEVLLDPRGAERGWTNPAEVQLLLRQHAEGSRDHAKRIWTLVSLELWARQHVDAHTPWHASAGVVVRS